MKRSYLALAAALMLAIAPMAVYAEGAEVLDHKMADIDGNEVDLETYKGKVVMIVNVASKCGLTPQYAQLVEIHEKFKAEGFEILGFPANDFLSQEPGTNAEIKTFCSDNYGVEFPVFSKISVKGEEKAEIYKELTSEEMNPGFGGEITWNFEKFLVGKDGKVVARFSPKTKPNDEEVVAAIEKELKG